MAIINCPECGNNVSDKAATCIHCGCPLENLSPSGTVRIKLSFVKVQNGLNGKQKASIMANGSTLWEGQTGETVDIHFDGPTSITVKYHTSMMHYGGTCTGIIDPSKSKKYNVSTRVGFMSTKLTIQPVDVFDAD